MTAPVRGCDSPEWDWPDTREYLTFGITTIIHCISSPLSHIHAIWVLLLFQLIVMMMLFVFCLHVLISLSVRSVSLSWSSYSSDCSYRGGSVASTSISSSPPSLAQLYPATPQLFISSILFQGSFSRDPRHTPAIPAPILSRSSIEHNSLLICQMVGHHLASTRISPSPTPNCSFS